MNLSFSKITEVCLYVSDLDQCLEFYHHKLGLPLISKVEGRHIFFRCGQNVLLCFLAEVTLKEARLPAHGARGPQHIAFGCEPEAYADWKKKLQGLDIEIMQEITWPSGLQSCYFEDPDGHVLEVVPHGLWGEER
ncbi:MAG: VOC family protein [Bacteroidota bacterium]